jgi:hypothetical protein
MKTNYALKILVKGFVAALITVRKKIPSDASSLPGASAIVFFTYCKYCLDQPVPHEDCPAS